MAVKWTDIELNDEFWGRFYLPFPLVIIGSKEEDHFNLAPKHLAMPLSWKNDFGFICTPEHKTYHNIQKHKYFSVSYPKVEQLTIASLTSSPREEDDDKGIINYLATKAAKKIEGIVLEDAFLVFECELSNIYDDFGINSLIAGKIVHAYADSNYLRRIDIDHQAMLFSHPLPVYLFPDRYSVVKESAIFPFPIGFKRC